MSPMNLNAIKASLLGTNSRVSKLIDNFFYLRNCEFTRNFPWGTSKFKSGRAHWLQTCNLPRNSTSSMIELTDNLSTSSMNAVC